MDKNSFFWKIVDGRLPAPPCAKTLGIEFVQIDGERGSVEVKFEAKPEFLNPAGNVQGGFLAAMLDDTMGPALTATLDAGEFDAERLGARRRRQPAIDDFPEKRILVQDVAFRS